jgi:hypothetical protein
LPTHDTLLTKLFSTYSLEQSTGNFFAALGDDSGDEAPKNETPAAAAVIKKKAPKGKQQSAVVAEPSKVEYV